jgi:hypothetical protein
MAGALPGGGVGPAGPGLTWAGLAGLEAARNADPRARSAPEHDEAPPGRVSLGAPVAKPITAPPQTLREQLSAAAAAGEAPPAGAAEAAASGSGGGSGGAAGEREASLVSLALKVRTHGGAPYDARVPGVPLPPRVPAFGDAGATPWCVLRARVPHAPFIR